MRRRSPSWLASLMLASGLLALGACSAAAAYFELPNSSWRSTWRQVEFTGGFGTVRCSLTLEGTFSRRTFEPTAGLLVGYVTRASVGPCPSGSATVLTAALPWHVRYSSFTGTLPTITAVSFNVVGAAMQVREPTFGIVCLLTTTTTEPMTLSGSTGEPDEEGVFPFSTFRFGEGPIETSCGIRAALAGTGTPTVAGETAPVHVEAKPYRGVLGIEPTEPRIAKGSFELLTLKNVAPNGAQRLKINEIISEKEEEFAITDVGECAVRRKELATFDPSRQICRIKVEAKVEGRARLIRIRYKDPTNEQSEVVRVVSP